MFFGHQSGYCIAMLLHIFDWLLHCNDFQVLDFGLMGSFHVPCLLLDVILDYTLFLSAHSWYGAHSSHPWHHWAHLTGLSILLPRSQLWDSNFWRKLSHYTHSCAWISSLHLSKLWGSSAHSWRRLTEFRWSCKPIPHDWTTELRIFAPDNVFVKVSALKWPVLLHSKCTYSVQLIWTVHLVATVNALILTRFNCQWHTFWQNHTILSSLRFFYIDCLTVYLFADTHWVWSRLQRLIIFLNLLILLTLNDAVTPFSFDFFDKFFCIP